MNHPKVFADFHNADAHGRLRLNCIGTVEDLAQQQVVLRDGLPLTFYSEELEVEGVVQYSTDENVWVAVIDWSAIRDVGPQALSPEAKTIPQRHIAEQLPARAKVSPKPWH
jgi:hypothetical protein